MSVPLSFEAIMYSVLWYIHVVHVVTVSNRRVLCAKYRGEGRGERGGRGEGGGRERKGRGGRGERYEPSTVTGKVPSEEPPSLLAVMCTA